MKEVVLLSGKGGTGKTLIAASLAALAGSRVMADGDVFADDLRRLLEPVTQERYEFWGQPLYSIDEERCIQCGRCEEVCRFGAINDVINNCIVDAIACEGCGFCYHNCYDEAIIKLENLTGNWFVSNTGYGPLVHAALGFAYKNGAALITLIRKEARRIAEKQGLEYILTDGPPGIGGSTIASLAGADQALLVTEPTLPAIEGLERIIGVGQFLKVPMSVCINKCDVDANNAQRIEALCRRHKIEIVAEIPYDRGMARGEAVTVGSKNSIAAIIKDLWDGIAAR